VRRVWDWLNGPLTSRELILLMVFYAALLLVLLVKVI
jgi:hypothetical protein